MSVLICKMCGGDLEIREGMMTVRCPYCGTNQTLPKFGNEQRLRFYDRANHFRRNNDYDKAMAMYEQILNEDQTDSEAYWSIVLCRYGIEYVEDPATHKMIPTVNRTQYTSVFADEDYKAALRYADAVQAGIYEEEAKAIDAIQKGILLVSQKEDQYDAFICYKELDEGGNRTRDSVLADELYYELTRNGFRVFFARITLQNKLGEAYEPYIFAALHSARVMIVIGTTPGNFQAVWVRNEWSRYLSLIRQGEKKVLIPAYRDMNPYELPKEFSHLQALDMSRPGFKQDLINGVKKILVEPKSSKTEWKTYSRRIGAVFGIAFVLAIVLLDVKSAYQRWRILYEKNRKITAEKSVFVSDTGRKQNTLQIGQTDEKVDFTGVLEEFVSSVYQRPATDVSDSQLAKIQQLVISRNGELWQIGYSFEAPKEELVWISLSSEEKLDLSSLGRFSNLKKLDVDSAITAEDISGLSLESISAYFDDPAAAAEVLENPKTVRELGFNGIVYSLDGIELFENLKSLYINDSKFDSIDELIHVKHLKNLTLRCNENLTDFSVLEKLSELEMLSLEARGMKTLDFISGLKHLDTLKITGGKLQTLSGIEGCTTLRSLSVTSCMELKDMSAVTGLKNLQELALDMPYGCSEPKLNGLTGLKILSLEQFHDCSFLQDMVSLTELHLSGCDITEEIDLSKLTSLTTLSCTSYVGSPLEVDMIEKFEMLECLDLHGSVSYDDISGLFQMPKLRELNISGMQCEIDFDAIVENPALEIMYMDDMYLFENVYIDYNSGIVMIDWDKVTLDEHMDFLKKFPGLKELYLRENGLTDLSFAEGLPALQILDISENYITELRPLARLPSLQKVVCAGNPLKNEKVLMDSVLIVK